MTTTDPIIDAENDEEEVVKVDPSTIKIQKFGAPSFQGGSKFGKWPSGSANPQLKQRPGRAAARGR